MTLRPSCLATLAYIRLRVLGLAGRHGPNVSSVGMKPYIRSGEKKDPNTLPRTTEITAAASSPPALRVMTTLDAIVVGRHAVTSRPTRTGMEGVSLSRAPAAIHMWKRATGKSRRRLVGHSCGFLARMHLSTYLGPLSGRL